MWDDEKDMPIDPLAWAKDVPAVPLEHNRKWGDSGDGDPVPGARSFYDVFWPDPPPRRQPTSTITPATARGRMKGLLRTLRDAPEGTRNTVLHWVACRVGEMIAAGEVTDPDTAVNALYDVGLSTGLDPREVLPTISSGFRESGVTP